MPTNPVGRLGSLSQASQDEPQVAIDNKHNPILGKAKQSVNAIEDLIGLAQLAQDEAQAAIDNKHNSTGGDAGLLGIAIEDIKGCPDSVGFFRLYKNGVIYWTPSTNAHEIHGAILGKWSSLGFERSFLGYPVSDEGELGFANGRFSNFQNGQIAWTPTSGAAVSSSSFHTNGGSGIRPQGLGSGGAPEIRRRAVASAHMEITDDETFGSNEHGAADNQTEGFITSKVPRTLLVLIGKAGGEVRVELKLDASVMAPEGDILISGTAKLFEGTSEESDDLDGTTEINFAVPRDGVISQAINVRNTDEGGDFADIRLTVSNFAA